MIVTADDPGIRESWKRDECAYCYRKVGHEHGIECVIPKRKVRVRFTFDIEADVPHGWDKDAIEFRYNESSWCADNAIQELDKLTGDNHGGDCLCGKLKVEYLGEVEVKP